MSDTESGRFHALLIGIDSYSEAPLTGCVNDIDQVQTFLCDKLGVTPDRIVRLEAPVSGTDTIPPERQPTYANLVTQLRRLASSQVQRHDRVFIYYSGHGSSEPMAAADSYFECLVPVDYEQTCLLYDVELSQLLQAIAERSGDLTVILDCCYASGATRDLAFADSIESRARFLPLGASRALRQSAANPHLPTPATAAASQKVPEEYTVIAACHADEFAAECRMPPKVGKTHGLLSYSLFEILNKVEPQALAQLRWSDIWEQLKATINGAKPNQRPLLLGPAERRVFGGPWQPQDTGYAVHHHNDGSYVIAAGRLAGLGVGAQIAVYGPEPAKFPPLRSAADHEARLGVLEVESVQLAECVARPIPAGSPTFAIPRSARGRLIKQGAPDLLRVALSRNLDPKVRHFLVSSAARFVVLGENDPSAEAHVGQYADGDIWIGDDLFGPGVPVEPTAPGPMARVSRSEAEDEEHLAAGLCAGLDHYAQYVVPLRTYRNGGFSLPVQSIAVKLFDCTDVADRTTIEREASLRREAPRDEHRRYVIPSGTPVAIHVENTLSTTLYVYLLLCNLSGQIEFLDGDVVINPRSGKIFWHRNIIGDPFRLVCSEGHNWGIDRLIVIATDKKGMDLRVLNQKKTMNEVIREALGERDVERNTAKNPAALCWTAVQTLIQIGQPTY